MTKYYKTVSANLEKETYEKFMKKCVQTGTCASKKITEMVMELIKEDESRRENESRRPDNRKTDDGRNKEPDKNAGFPKPKYDIFGAKIQ